MYRWLALMDEHGKELDYPGYSRVKVPAVHEEWEVHQFARWLGPQSVIVAGVWFCDSETSRMRDGHFIQVIKAIHRGEHPNIHLGPCRRDLVLGANASGDA